MATTSFTHLTMIGLGLIGGSFAMAARAVHPDLHICGVDPDTDALTFALQNDVVNQVSQTLPTEYPGYHLPGHHLIVLANHLSQSETVLTQLHKIFSPLSQASDLQALEKTFPGERLQPSGTHSFLITDVGSCKRSVCALGKSLFPHHFIGGHPMAGKEVSGVRQAASLLFAGKAYLLCPHSETPFFALEKLEAFVQSMGALPKLVNPEEHDRYMAYVSHLPQLYSILLTNLLFSHEPGKLLSLHGGGIDDQLRLAASPYAMWGDVFGENADNLKTVLQELKALIEETETKLGTPAMADLFTRSNLVHQEFQEYRNR
ncbi:MAG: prephenate dehydrogenase/arogenate dehydrogenase family protein [Cyanobacteria bacterium]|nr:prephenate dehydrogenase/arogenate dehydrogenase family protein [Cyanobacteriota bacterium]